MSKWWTLAALSAVMLVGVVAQASTFVYINGQAMMPLRSFGETFGASFTYNSRHGFDLSLDYHKATIFPGSRRIYIDSRPVLLDADVIEIDGITYVPVDFIDQFGYTADWDSNDDQVIFVHPRSHHRVVLVCDRGWHHSGYHAVAPRYHDEFNDVPRHDNRNVSVTRRFRQQVQRDRNQQQYQQDRNRQDKQNTGIYQRFRQQVQRDKARQQSQQQRRQESRRQGNDHGNSHGNGHGNGNGNGNGNGHDKQRDRNND